MAGYDGYSMSNNARDAYSDGEKPISKWTKSEILKSVSEIRPDIVENLKKIDVKTLKSKLLFQSSWHHSSKYYNKTDFYSLDVDVIQELTNEEIQEMLSSKNEQSKQEQIKSEKYLCRYLVWGGTRKHPKAHEEESEGEIKGNWFYLPDGRKKSITSNGFSIVKKL